jgi:L-fuconolactonase
MARLRRDFLPDDLKPELDRCQIRGSIAVQARQTLAESEWLLDLADAHPVIHGVVGWADLRSATVEDDLARLAEHPRFVGVRHVVQDEPDDRFLLQPDFLRGVSQLRRFDLAYDLLIYPRQLPAAIDLARRLPEQTFVVDHLAKPPIRSGATSGWAEAIRELAKSPNVFCKVSGMVTEADWNRWRREDLEPYWDIVFDAFGPERLLYGSDWPVCLAAAEYEKVFEAASSLMEALSSAERENVMGFNAARAYRIEPESTFGLQPIRPS